MLQTTCHRTTARRGSILILVLALLVMMALIGTAYMSTARIDRGDAIQNGRNTQTDLLTQGLINTVEADIVRGLFDPVQGFKAVPAPTLTYADYDSELPDPTNGNFNKVTMPNNYWLGSRVPSRANSTNVGWRSISYPAMAYAGTGTGPNGPIRQWIFAEPLVTSGAPTAGANGYLQLDGNKAAHFWQVSHTTRNNVDYPALTDLSTGKTYMAADADGDGRADSLYFRLTGLGPTDGLTYYGAVRIIDNSAAVNINTALGKVPGANATAAPLLDADLDANGNRWAAIFPAGVSLDRLLINPSTEMQALLGTINTQTNSLSLAAVTQPMDDTLPTPATRGDFNYLTYADAWHHCIGRRIAYPAAIPAASGNRFEPLGFTDSANLASQFVIRGVVGGTTENVLANSTLTGASASPFPGDSRIGTKADPWYAYNFDYTNLTSAGNAMPGSIRSLLTTNNPIGNTVVPHARYLLPATVGGGVSGDSSAAGNGQPVIMATTQPAVANGTNRMTLKENLNTADFAHLWRAYWDTMAADDADPQYLPDPYNNHYLPATIDRNLGIFRSWTRYGGSLNDPNAPVLFRFDESSPNKLFLRAALAAANTLHMRTQTHQMYHVQTANPYNGVPAINDVPTIALTSGVNPSAGNAVTRVYGVDAQPYLVEVFASNDTKTVAPNAPNQNPNDKGYVALKFFNPFPYPIKIDKCALMFLNRSYNKTNNKPNDQITEAKGGINLDPTVTTGIASNSATSLSPMLIPPHGYLLMENFKFDGSGDAKYRPPNTGVPVTTTKIGAGTTPTELTGYSTPLFNAVYVPGLAQCLGTAGTAQSGAEVVLLRPTSAQMITTTNEPVAGYPGWGPKKLPQILEYVRSGKEANYWDFIPLDQYDFTTFPLSSGPTFTAWHYTRPSSFSNGTTWRWVHPGTYNATGTADGVARYLGTENPVNWKQATDPAFLTWPGTAPGLNPDDATNHGVGVTTYSQNDAKTLNYPPIQLASLDITSLNAVQSGSGNTFPFGGFMRTADVMNVPFVGAYQVRVNGQFAPTEFSSVTMDVAFADDGDASDDQGEFIGHMVPIGDPLNNTYDFKPAANLGGTNDTYRYHWAMKALDYFTVLNNPYDDYTPNTHPDMYGYVANNTINFTSAGLPSPTPNADPTKINNGLEDMIAAQGKININTAPWPVIAMLPLAPNPTTGDVDAKPGQTTDAQGNKTAVDRTVFLAQQIVAYRDQYGPFKSLYDLMRVPYFANACGTTPNLPDQWWGNYLGDSKGGPDNVPGDWRSKYIMINRISNLATVRSDTFTVYVLVEGWRNAGTANAQLVVQRRVAAIIDRSAINNQNKAAHRVMVRTNN